MAALTTREKLELNIIQVELTREAIADLSKKLCVLLDQTEQLTKQLNSEND